MSVSCNYDSDRMEAQLSQLHQQFPPSNQRSQTTDCPRELSDVNCDFQTQVQHQVLTLSWPFNLSEDDLPRQPGLSSTFPPGGTDYDESFSTHRRTAQLIDHPSLTDRTHSHPPFAHLAYPSSLPSSPTRMTDIDLIQFHSIESLDFAPPNVTMSTASPQARLLSNCDYTGPSADVDTSPHNSSQPPQTLSIPLGINKIGHASPHPVTHPSFHHHPFEVGTARLPYQESEASNTPTSNPIAHHQSQNNLIHSSCHTGDETPGPLQQSLPPDSALPQPGCDPVLSKSTGGRSSHPRSPVDSFTPQEIVTHRPSLDSGCGFDLRSASPSPSLPFCPILLSKLRTRADLTKKKKAPVSSTSRLRVFRQDSLCSSTNNSEIERGFTSEDDADRIAPFTSQTIQSMAGAPLPVVYGLLQYPHPQLESARSTPSNGEVRSSKPHSRSHTPQTEQGPLRLSKDNLSRQAAITSSSELQKKRSKLRETEKWARETACSSQSHSPDIEAMRRSRQGSMKDLPLTISVNSSFVSLVDHSNDEAQLPDNGVPAPPDVVLHPAPLSRMASKVEPGITEITSEVASVNEWLSETTQAGVVNGRLACNLSQLSPCDTSDQGAMPLRICPGTVIGDHPGEMVTDGNLTPEEPQSRHPYQHGLGPLSSPFVLKHDQREKDMTDTSSSNDDTHEDLANQQLIRARMSLQQALATTPQARLPEPSPSLPTPTQDTMRNETKTPTNEHPNDLSDQSSEESGLSPIKEDRTAEMAAERSWSLKHSNRNSGDHHIAYGMMSPSGQPFGRQGRDSDMTCAHQLAQLDQAESLLAQIELMGLVDSNNASHDPNQDSNPATSHFSSPIEGLDTRIESIPADETEEYADLSNELNAPVTTFSDSSRSGIQTSSRSTPDSCRRRSQPTHINTTPTQSEDRASSPPHPRSVSVPLPSQLASLGTVARRTTGSQRTTINPPPSLPAHARKAPPADSLNRNEMDEWKLKTGIDDRFALSLKGYQAGIDNGPLSSLPGGLKRVIGLGGEERRGMKDRWGNTWGLESHLLSPLSERTERSLTTVTSCLSLSTRPSMHSLRSIESHVVHGQPNNPLVHRLNEADLHSLQLMKMSSTNRVQSAPLARVMIRSTSCPIKAGLPEQWRNGKEVKDLNLLEEKRKRREARRLKREKREKRRLDEHSRSETMAQKHERRRQEKEKKEKFLEQKQVILQQLQADNNNPTLIRDLGILYLSCNAGAAGIKLAIRHLETSLQMSSTDPWAWSSLGKAWAQLHALSEQNPAIPHTSEHESEKQQQAHNATIGLRKAILNSRSASEAMKYKIEWAHYLEQFGRWRESLGVMSEVISNEGKNNHSGWAALGFIGLRIGLGLSPLTDLETEALSQGFQEHEDTTAALNESVDPPELTIEDRLKLLEQVGQAFHRAIELIEAQFTTDATDDRSCLRRLQDHYDFQLVRLDEVLDTLKSRPNSSIVESGEDPQPQTTRPNESGAGSHDRAPLRHSRSQPDLTVRGENLDRPDFLSSAQLMDNSTHRASPAALSASETARSSTRCSSVNNDTPDVNPEVDRIEEVVDRLLASPDVGLEFDGANLLQAADQLIMSHNQEAQRSHKQEVDSALSPIEGHKDDSNNLHETGTNQNDTRVESGPPLSASPTQLPQSPDQCRRLVFNQPPLHPIMPYGSESDHVLQYDDVDTTNDFTEDLDLGASRYSQAGTRMGHNVRHYLPYTGSVGSVGRESSKGVHERQESVHKESLGQPGNDHTMKSSETWGDSPRRDICFQSPTSCSIQDHDDPSSALQHSNASHHSHHSNASHHSHHIHDLDPSNLEQDKSSRPEELPIASGSDQKISTSPPGSEQRCIVLLPHSSTQNNSNQHKKPFSPLSQQDWQLPSPVGSSNHPASMGPPSSFAHLDQAFPRRLRERCSSHSERYSEGSPRGVPLSHHHPSTNDRLPDPLPSQYRDRMLAFLELDETYHSRARQLKMRLLEVEDEHERRRREMMEELGLNELVTGNQTREEVRVTRRSNQIPSSDHRSRSTCSHLAAGLSPSHPSPKRFINPQIITPKKPINNLMPGFQSTTHHTPLIMGDVNEVGHDHRLILEHEIRNVNTSLGNEVDSRIGELGHAEIALQGIAAILRLAKSPS